MENGWKIYLFDTNLLISLDVVERFEYLVYQAAQGTN